MDTDRPCNHDSSPRSVPVDANSQEGPTCQLESVSVRWLLAEDFVRIITTLTRRFVSFQLTRPLDLHGVRPTRRRSYRCRKRRLKSPGKPILHLNRFPAYLLVTLAAGVALVVLQVQKLIRLDATLDLLVSGPTGSSELNGAYHLLTGFIVSPFQFAAFMGIGWPTWRAVGRATLTLIELVQNSESRLWQRAGRQRLISDLAEVRYGWVSFSIARALFVSLSQLSRGSPAP